MLDEDSEMNNDTVQCNDCSDILKPLKCLIDYQLFTNLLSWAFHGNTTAPYTGIVHLLVFRREPGLSI